MLESLWNIDAGILLWIQDVLRTELFNPVVCLYTHLGDHGMLWIVLCLAMVCYKPTRRAGLAGLLAMLFGMVVTNLTIKPLIARTRPWLDVPGLAALVAEPDPCSFPSGHTCAAFAAASAWWRTAKKRWMRAGGVALAVFMGLSRLYVGVHYPSDVLAGALIGVFCGWLAVKLCRRALWKERKP